MAAAATLGRQMNKDYTIQAVARALRVVAWLAQGEIREWKSIREVAAGTGLPDNACFRILETLVAEKWAEKSGKGYRQDTAGLIRHAVYAQNYMDNAAQLKGDG